MLDPATIRAHTAIMTVKEIAVFVLAYKATELLIFFGLVLAEHLGWL